MPSLTDLKMARKRCSLSRSNFSPRRTPLTSSEVEKAWRNLARSGRREEIRVRSPAIVVDLMGCPTATPKGWAEHGPCGRGRAIRRSPGPFSCDSRHWSGRWASRIEHEEKARQVVDEAEQKALALNRLGAAVGDIAEGGDSVVPTFSVMGAAAMSARNSEPSLRVMRKAGTFLLIQSAMRLMRQLTSDASTPR